jgi:hypothetical protein
LLVYVGLALILALANGETNLIKEQVRSWLVLAHPPPVLQVQQYTKRNNQTEADVERSLGYPANKR